jgi:hypothetical protein
VTRPAQFRKYVLVTRTWWVGDQDRSARGTVSPDNAWIAPGRRAIGRSESDVFADFPVSAAIVVPPPDVLPSEVLYTNCKTTGFIPPGNRLRINAVTRRVGEILVEVCARNPGCTNLQPLPGRSFADATPVGGDQFRSLVTWKGGEDLGQPSGQPVAGA